MPRLQPSVYREILIHLVAWLCYIGLQVVAIDKFEHRYVANLLSALAQLPAQLIFTYVTLYVLIPGYLLTQRYVQFGLLTLLALLICGMLYWEGTYYLYLVPFEPARLKTEKPWDLGWFMLCAFYLLCTSGLLIGFHMIRFGFRQQQLNQQLVIANQRIELKSLKDQINPHFLFNTLNNLYGLTSQNPQKAGEVVLRLAQLMQYMLYEGNLAQVPLPKEVSYLQNYLALERIRYGDRLHLSIQVSGATDRLFIAPLLLLPFVENAFKHGISRQLDDAWLQIQLTVSSTELVFKVENSKPELTNEAPATGIGLSNIAKRLQLIYPNRHQLRQLNGTGTYLATLTLALTSSDFRSEKTYEDQMFAG
ncbi:histidine kinase [Spirosoma sp. BT702]|uniref:Histidine kinase n=1 Tax=Spirosoma profusum TaxID=2771354 RepID=A0A926Y223_9BACT|nr:histidine kinase [Spirosoma profusum]MBD2702707.1 histidine kinase [Spirosoma profusum]